MFNVSVSFDGTTIPVDVAVPDDTNVADTAPVTAVPALFVIDVTDSVTGPVNEPSGATVIVSA